MRILLLQPPLVQTDNVQVLKELDDRDNTLVSTGLYSIATVLLDEGFEVSLLNQTTTPWQKAISEIQQFKPDLVGITSLTHDRYAVMQLVDTLKQIMPLVKIALGGAHASCVFPKILRKHPSVDYIAIGEAETSLLELVRRLDAGEPTTGIKGIVQRKPGVDYTKSKQSIPVAGTCDTYADFDWAGPADPIMELGKLPVPAKYFKYSMISTARGCPFNCNFCNSPQVWGRKVRYRPVEHVLEEITLLRDKHGVEKLNFKDETFTMHRKRIVELCKAMVDAKLNIQWTCDTRVDCLGDEQLYWMCKAGCGYISLGVESGSERMLSQIDKTTSLDKIRKATALARKYGLLVRYYMMVNLPGETDQDRQDSIDIIEEGKPHYVFASELSILPGTELYNQYCREKNIDDSIWFEDSRRFIPYSEDSGWRETTIGKKLLSYSVSVTKEQQFPYTEAELRDIQSMLSDCSGANHHLANYLSINKKYTDAIQYYRLAVEIWPDFTKGWIGLGICLLNLNRTEEARDLFTKLSKNISNNARIWEMLGNAHLNLHTYQQAERCFRKVIDLQAGHVDVFNKLGSALEFQNKNEEALEVFKEALALAPGNSFAGSSMVRIHKASRQQKDG